MQGWAGDTCRRVGVSRQGEDPLHVLFRGLVALPGVIDSGIDFLLNK